MFAGGSSRATEQAEYFLPLAAVQNRHLLSDGCEVWVRADKDRGIVVAGNDKPQERSPNSKIDVCMAYVLFLIKILEDVRNTVF